MSKRRGRNGSKNAEASESLGRMIEHLEPEVKEKAQALLQDFIQQRKAKLQELESIKKKDEVAIRNHFRNLVFTIPKQAQSLKIGEIRDAGGIVDIFGGGIRITIPTNLFREASALPPLTVPRSAKKVPRSTTKRHAIPSPHATSTKKKIAKVAARPSHQLLQSVHGTSMNSTISSTTRNLRSTARKVTATVAKTKRGAILQEEQAATASARGDNLSGMALQKEIIESVRTPGGGKVFKKPARLPRGDEAIVIVSTTGTPLLTDGEWIKTRCMANGK